MKITQKIKINEKLLIFSIKDGDLSTTLFLMVVWTLLRCSTRVFLQVVLYGQTWHLCLQPLFVVSSHLWCLAL